MLPSIISVFQKKLTPQADQSVPVAQDDAQPTFYPGDGSTSTYQPPPIDQSMVAQAPPEDPAQAGGVNFVPGNVQPDQLTSTISRQAAEPTGQIAANLTRTPMANGAERSMTPQDVTNPPVEPAPAPTMNQMTKIPRFEPTGTTEPQPAGFYPNDLSRFQQITPNVPTQDEYAAENAATGRNGSALVAPPPGAGTANDPGETAGWNTAPGYTAPETVTPLEDEKDPRRYMARVAAGEKVSKSTFLKRALKGALMGGVTGFARGGIGGAIGGAGAGLIGEGFFPKVYQSVSTNQQAAQMKGKVAYFDKQADEQEKQRKAAADTQSVLLGNQSKKIENAYKIVTDSPRWKAAMEKKTITQADAEYFNTIAGINLTPADWQTVKQEWANGKAFNVNERGVASRNTGLPIRPDEVPSNVDFGGGPIALTPKEAAPILAGQINQDANRKQGADEKNASMKFEAAKINAGAWNDNAKQKISLQEKALAPFADMISGNESLKAQNQSVQQFLGIAQAAADRLSKMAADDADREKAQKKFDDAQGDFAKAQDKFGETLGKFKGAAAAKAAFDSVKIDPPKTVEATTITPTQVVKPPAGANKGGKNNNIGTMTEYQRAMQKVRGH